MKRNAVKILAASLILMVGITAAGLWLHFSRKQSAGSTASSSANSSILGHPDIPFVAFCDLVRDSGSYDQKIIRTRAILSVGTDTRTLWDEGCKGVNSYVGAECFHPPEKTCEEIFAAIDKFRGGEKGGWLRANTSIDVVGQFYSPAEGGRRARLEMLEIRDAKAIR